jgi:hypothetical protein
LVLLCDSLVAARCPHLPIPHCLSIFEVRWSFVSSIFAVKLRFFCPKELIESYLWYLLLFQRLTTQMTFTHASYTVAWICALPLELAAAKVFLDQVHPRLTQPESDHNAYTLGSVSGHNVVVACLPAGVYGTTSATAAVSHLMSTYQNVRFGLMVGVGGWVPRGNPDIRLGDIVVSKPCVLR